MAGTVHAFQLGSSTVVTLPKKLGIRPGQELKIEKSKDKIILKPHKKMTKEESQAQQKAEEEDDDEPDEW